MLLNVRFDGDVAILSDFGGLLNDPRYVDALKDVRAVLEGGHRKFVFDLAGLRKIGPTAIGLLMTLTREIRQGGGEAVLAKLSPAIGGYLEEMRMDDYWDVFEGVEAAKAFYARNG